MPEISISRWSARYRRLSGESSRQPGRFVAFPYQVEPMDSANDPDVAETVLMWAAQMSKSETINNIHGFYIHADPAPQLHVQPTIDLAKEYSKDRIAPMIRDTPVLRRIVRDPKSRDASNTTLGKRYPGGSLVLVGANAPSGLAGRPRRIILQDEIDRFPVSAGTEGDPCALADKRAESFEDTAVFFKSSTPTIKGASRIEKLYEKSDKRQWHVPCAKCSAEFVMLWKHVCWPDGHPEDAYIECPHCHAHLNDPDRIQMVRAGRWVATAKFNGIRGYWINGLNTLFKHHKGFRGRLHEFVAQFLKAKDDGPEMLKVWTNTFLAETYEEEAEGLDSGGLSARAEDYTPDALPEGVLLLTAAADVHRMRIEVGIEGWGVDEENWGVRKVVLDGDTERDEIWAQLDELLLREFEREDGVRLTIERAFIDMGYRPKQVLRFCAPRIGRGVYPCRGLNRVGTNPPPLLPAKPNRNNKARIPHWNVGVTVAKSTIYDRLKLEIPGPRTMHFPRGEGYDEEHFKQFAAEKRKVKYSAGVAYHIFEKINNAARNEALDLKVYNLAAMHSLAPIFWRKLKQVRDKQADKSTPSHDVAEHKSEAADDTREERDQGAERSVRDTEAPEPKKKAAPQSYTEQQIAKTMTRTRRRVRGGFVGGWR